MFFVGINILEVIKLKSDETKIKEWRRNEIAMGLRSGVMVGISIAIVAFFSLNIWFLLFPSANNLLALSTIVVVWIGFVVISTLYYKPFPYAIYRNLTFSIGLLATIGLINYSYNTLAYSIDLPYSSLRTVQVMVLVVVGSSLGLMIKTILRPKRTEAKETLQ